MTSPLTAAEIDELERLYAASHGPTSTMDDDIALERAAINALPRLLASARMGVPQGDGASASGPGSRPSGHAGCAVDGASRFDPSRDEDACYLEACQDLIRGDWKPNKGIYLDLLATALRLQGKLEAVERVISTGYPDRKLKHGETCSHGSFGFQDCIGCYDEALLAALCDSDGSPKGGDADAAPSPDDSAAIAQNPPQEDSPDVKA